jgi:hypothetical protein
MRVRVFIFGFALAVYGLTTMRNAPPGAGRFATFMLSSQAQDILAPHGFTPVGSP